MAYWKTGYRKINGHRRKVRLFVSGGKVKSVRKYGHANYTNRTARKRHHHRKAGYYNATSRAGRTSGRLWNHLYGSLKHYRG